MRSWRQFYVVFKAIRRTDLQVALKSVSRDAVVYGVGVVAQRLATILLLPIYTRLLTPRDYGLIELLQLSVEITTILVSAGTMSGVLRFYYKRCLLYTSPSPRDATLSRMPSSA